MLKSLTIDMDKKAVYFETKEEEYYIYSHSSVVR
jgi:hypothetical protein